MLGIGTGAGVGSGAGKPVIGIVIIDRTLRKNRQQAQHKPLQSQASQLVLGIATGTGII